MGELLDILLAYAGSIWLLVLALGTAIVIEIVSPKVRYGFRDRLQGILIYLIAPFFAALAAIPLQSVWKNVDIAPILDLRELPPVAVVAYLVLSYDFINYWEHRFEHRFLWPIHAAHHSVSELHAANSAAHPLQTASMLVFHSLHFSLIRLDSHELPLLASFLIGLWAIVIHSPTRVHLGPLRRIIVDPRYHRIHHSMEERHFDRNFAPIFSIWDQLFGTAYFPDKNEHPEVGVAGLNPPESVTDFLVLPLTVIRSDFRRARSGEPHVIKDEPEPRNERGSAAGA